MDHEEKYGYENPLEGNWIWEAIKSYFRWQH
jgi:hypothetical protein